MKWAKWFITILLIVPVSELDAREIHVSKKGEVTTLGRALERASDGDVIVLHEGIYPEHNLVVDKSVTIRGEGKAVIDGEEKGFVLIVRADGVTIRNIEIHNSSKSFMEDYAGLLLEEVSGALIEEVTLAGNFFGIYLSKTSDTVIRNNRVMASGKRETKSGNGIHLWYSKDITIEDNVVEGHRDGIYFEFVQDVIIKGNESRKNLRYGLHFMFSDRCRFTENLFENNGAGVAVMYTDKVVMKNNRFMNNWGSSAYGLLMKEIRESKVIGNRFENNSIALYMESSNRNRIKENQFLNNGWGVKVMANSMDNLFMKNDFVENTFEVSTNSQQNFNIFDKNYWSQYSGYDLDRNGVGDVPYRPVRLFSIMVERQPALLVLMRSMLIQILDTAERIMPVLTPDALVDKHPIMERYYD